MTWTPDADKTVVMAGSLGPEFDEVLVAAQGGDESAVGRLWRAFNPSLVRYLRVRHGEAADDVASETWLRASQSLARFHGTESDFRAWFFTVARAASVDWYRKAGRRPAVAGDPTDLVELAAADDTASAALDLLTTEQAIALLQRLSQDQAEVIALRVVAGLDIERVSRIVGKRTGTVRVLQHRGLRRLAQIIETERARMRGVTP
jgi:RNA polymerase sigma-70 factor (ECF subfamily)